MQTLFARNFDGELLAKTPSPYIGNLGEFLRYARRLNERLSAEARSALGLLASGSTKFHQFTHIPVTEPLPATPIEYLCPVSKRTFQSEGVMAAVSLELGGLFGYEETSKHLMYDIYPVEGCEDSSSFLSSRRALAFHTDGSAHPELSPDYVVLYCIRNEPQSVNLVADLDVLLQELPVKVVEVLMQPLFKHMVRQLPRERYDVKPVLFVEGGNMAVKYDEETVVGLNEKAIDAQTALNRGIRKVAETVVNTDNSLLILNNKRLVHARTSFEPRFDGGDRWIKAVFVTKTDLPNGSMLTLPL